MLVTLISAILLCTRSMSDPFLVDVYVQSALESTVQVTAFADENIHGYSLSFHSNEPPGLYTNDVMENEVIAFVEQSAFSNSVYTVHGRDEYPLFVIDLSTSLDKFRRPPSTEEEHIVLPSFPNYELPDTFSIINKNDAEGASEEPTDATDAASTASTAGTASTASTASTANAASTANTTDGAAPTPLAETEGITETLSETTTPYPNSDRGVSSTTAGEDVVEGSVNASIKLRDGVLVISVPDFNLVLSAQKVR